MFVLNARKTSNSIIRRCVIQSHFSFFSDTLICRTLHRRSMQSVRIDANPARCDAMRYGAVRCGYDTARCGAARCGATPRTDRLDERWSRERKGRRPRETINHLESILLFLLLLHTSRSAEIARQPQDYWLNERESTRPTSWRSDGYPRATGKYSKLYTY